MAEFTAEEVGDGLKRFLEKPGDFAPNLKTIRTCIIECLYPDYYEAYKEACNKASQPLHQDWSHVVVYKTGSEVGFYELRRSSQAQVLELFKKKYLDVCIRHRSGENIQIPIPEENRIPTFISNESKRKKAGKQAISEMLGMFE